MIKDALGATQIIRPHYEALGLQKTTTNFRRKRKVFTLRGKM